MAVPKYKPSKARTKRRRNINMRLAAPALSSCGNCGNVVLSHRLCPRCGFYRGRQIIEV
jgi:large subunit ribosomal protein L32